MVYAKVHQLIGEIATADQPADTWFSELKAVLRGFEAEAARLGARAARHVRDELCAQIEHEALVATRPSQRTILITALKNLEAIDWQPAR
ncbi:MAG: hypothetical protein MUE49_12580 [Rhodospirillales bacterium]|nr:hypothetical protein [Rhodospirillales bacterium]